MNPSIPKMVTPGLKLNLQILKMVIIDMKSSFPQPVRGAIVCRSEACSGNENLGHLLQTEVCLHAYTDNLIHWCKVNR